MRNLILWQTNISTLIPDKIIGFYIDEFSKVIVVLDKELRINIFQYEDIFSNVNNVKTIFLDSTLSNDMETLEDLNKENMLKYLLYKNEEESIHILTRSGKYIKIFFNETYEIIPISDKSEILAAEISPTLENILVVLSDFKILLLNFDFEIINSCDLDDGDNSDPSIDGNICEEASISWRGDSEYFCVLYSINGGKKCLVRDTKLNVFKGPARADNKVVFSVAEKPVLSKYLFIYY
jgi:hypothetical protein